MTVEPALRALKKIVTSFVYPPIPLRNCDWCAHYDGEEESAEYGWGETEEAAIQDLTSNYPDGGSSAMS